MGYLQKSSAPGPAGWSHLLRDRSSSQNSIDDLLRLSQRSGSLLFLFGSFDAIICFFQPEIFRHRAGRADATFLLERAGQRLPHYAEEQALISPHAFVIRRTWFADALPPVFFPEFFPIFCHYILSRPVLPGPINK